MKRPATRTPSRPQPTPRTPGDGATAPKRGVLLRFENHLLRHLQTLFYALGQLSRRPFATLMTVAVIGIALALPTGLHVLMLNAQAVTTSWDSTSRISLFLKKDIDGKRAQALADALRRQPGVAGVRYISREQALAEFRSLSGFGEALGALDENPLPAVLVVSPAASLAGPQAVQRLADALRARPEVDLAQLDMQWLQRLYALMGIVSRGVWVLAALLTLAVLLVVGNTIRLAIQNRRDEIVITKLIGGTDAFIRRPFLYTGLWYGLFGALIAITLVGICLWLLQGPVAQLAGLYDSTFRLRGLGTGETLLLLGFGTGLGLAGSWFAVGRHLREIEPR